MRRLLLMGLLAFSLIGVEWSDATAHDTGVPHQHPDLALNPPRSHSVVCDLYVNNIRVYSPPKFLNPKECVGLKSNMAARDKTKAKIICKCSEGDKT